MDIIQALNVLCEYKGRYKSYHKGKGKSELAFITKENIIYNVIVTNKSTEDGIIRNLIREMLDVPVIAFLSIVNSYQVLKAVEETNVEKIIFTLRLSDNKNLDYIIHRVYKDLIPLGYDIEIKAIKDYIDVLDDDFLRTYKLENVA